MFHGTRIVVLILSSAAWSPAAVGADHLVPAVDLARLGSVGRVSQRYGGPHVLVPGGDAIAHPAQSLAAVASLMGRLTPEANPRAAASFGLAPVLRIEQTLDRVLVGAEDLEIAGWLDGVGHVNEYLYDELILIARREPWRTERQPPVAALAELLAAVEQGGGSRVVLELGPSAEPFSAQSEALRWPRLSVSLKTPIPAMRNGKPLAQPIVDPDDAPARLPGDRQLSASELRPFLTSKGLVLQVAKPPTIPRRTAAKIDDLLVEIESPDDLTYRRALARLANEHPGELLAQAPKWLSMQKGSDTRLVWVAWNLGRIAELRPGSTPRPVISPLRALLQHTDGRVRGAAALALAAANDEAPIESIRRQLESTLAMEKENGRRPCGRRREHAELALALGRYGERAKGVRGTMETLLRLALTPAKSDDPTPQAMAARALGEIHAESAVDSLDSLARASKDPRLVLVRREALLALATIGGERALITLEGMLNLSDTEVDRLGHDPPGLAAEALTRFRVADRAPVLAKILVHGRKEARAQAIAACLRDPSPASRQLLELSADWAVPWWDRLHSRPTNEESIGGQHKHLSGGR